MATSKTIVLVHGNFVNNTTWNEWKSYYEQKGYTVYAPANLGHEGNAAELRSKTDPELAATGFKDIVNHLAAFIKTLPEKPLLIGHSMAGMAVLKLSEMGLAAATVSLNGAPPKNVFPPFATVKTVLPAFGFLSGKSVFIGSRAWYDQAFFNTLPDAEKARMFDAFAVPESFKVSRELVLSPFSNLDFAFAHQPILFIGGGQDHIFPASLTKKIAGKFKPNAGHVDLKIYPEKSHFIAGEPGWQNVADDILDWYEKL